MNILSRHNLFKRCIESIWREDAQECITYLSVEKILKKWLLQTFVSSYCSIALHYDNLWQIKLQRSFGRKWNIFFVELNVHIVRMVLEIQWYEVRLLSLAFYKQIDRNFQSWYNINSYEIDFFTFLDFLLRLWKVFEQRNKIIYSPNSQGSQYAKGHSNSLVA